MSPRLRICLWSGPRNVSTALMYSFAQRADTSVLDEPLYGHYLRVSAAPHPGSESVLSAMETDGERIVREVVLGPCDKPVLFMKHMAHHLVEIDRGFLGRCANVLLTRDPEQMLPSLDHQVPQATLRDTGYRMQTELLDELAALGQDPQVLDARELLLNPKSVLLQLCERLNIPFDESMLRWTAGPKPYDGVWAPHWYQNVHGSTGFMKYQPKNEPFPEKLLPLLAECRPHYERLHNLSLKAHS